METCKVTGLKQGVRDENRVNVYINGKFAFSLTVAQIVNFHIKVGDEISAEKLAEYKKASECGKLYQRALEWAILRPRSKKELYDYLCKKIYEKKIDKKYIDEIIQELEVKKYVDDSKFAEYYVENRFVKKGVSAKRLRMELAKKGVAKEIIEEAVSGSERSDEEEIKKIIEKKHNKMDAEKLVAYLCRQGFSFSLSRELVSQYEKD